MALVLMPIRVATLPLAATARIALPSMVRFITQSKPIMITTATASVSSLLGSNAYAEESDHRVAHRGRHNDGLGTPDRQADALQDDAEAKRAHDPSHAWAACERPNAK